jgi:hypothetical protein
MILERGPSVKPYPMVFEKGIVREVFVFLSIRDRDDRIGEHSRAADGAIPLVSRK